MIHIIKTTPKKEHKKQKQYSINKEKNQYFVSSLIHTIFIKKNEKLNNRISKSRYEKELE